MTRVYIHGQKKEKEEQIQNLDCNSTFTVRHKLLVQQVSVFVNISNQREEFKDL